MNKLEGLIFQHYHEELPTPLHRLLFSYYSLRQASKALSATKDATLSARIDSCSYKSPHIIFVIGESYNKHHSTLYGYPLPTTPLQQMHKDKEELYVFEDVVTPWNITSNVFFDLFSLKSSKANTSTHNNPLFPILFRRAGYSVSFFSNQYVRRGLHRGSTNQAGHFFLSDYELSDSLFTYRNLRAEKYDMQLIDTIKSYTQKHHQEDYTLDIIHLIGQHFEYSQRYPKAMEHFTLSDYSKRNLDDNAKQVLMHYDNSIFYNDTVMEEILHIFEEEESIVLFLSDHGEEAYDDLPIHGRLFQKPTAKQAQQEFEVPMWIWCSYRYRTKHPDVINQIKEATSRPFITSNISQVLLDLAGISCIWKCDKRNILNPKYNCGKRVIYDEIDYDDLFKQ